MDFSVDFVIIQEGYNPKNIYAKNKKLFFRFN